MIVEIVLCLSISIPHLLLFVSSAGAGRKRKETGTIADFLDDEDEDGSDFDPKEQDEEDLELSEDEKKPSAKQSARKKKIQQLKESGVEELTEQLSTMSVQKKSFDLSIKCPCIMYDYVDHNRKVVSVDLLVPNQHRRFFRLEVQGGKTLVVKVVIPKVFYNRKRILTANAGNKRFNKNSHKATAFSQLCKQIVKDLGKQTHPPGDGDDSDEEANVEVCDGEQCIELPFEVEDELYRGHKGLGKGYEVVALENEDDVLFAELEEPTDLFVLSVDLVSVEKTKKTAKGSMRKLKSPSKYDDSSEEDEEDDGEGEMED